MPSARVWGAPQGDPNATQLIIEDPSQVPLVHDNPVFLDLEAKWERRWRATSERRTPHSK